MCHNGAEPEYAANSSAPVPVCHTPAYRPYGDMARTGTRKQLFPNSSLYKYTQSKGI